MLHGIKKGQIKKEKQNNLEYEETRFFRRGIYLWYTMNTKKKTRSVSLSKCKCTLGETIMNKFYGKYRGLLAENYYWCTIQ